ncbi:MAG: SdrD B-like domain-containing protein [Caldilineaceae bacterium]
MKIIPRVTAHRPFPFVRSPQPRTSPRLASDTPSFPPNFPRKSVNLCALVLAFLIIGNLLVLFTPTAHAAPCTGSGITGAVFRDYNADGSRATAEPGLSGIIVTAYDASGTTTACETSADGSYGIDPVGAYPVRLEFTLPADGSLNFLHPGPAGSNSRTSVTFVDGPTANVDVGFSHPADFCGASPAPTMTTSCFVFGEQNDNPDGVNKDRVVMVSFPYTAGSTDLTNEQQVRTPDPTPLATAKEVGAVWGLTWNPTNQTIYAAAFMKRHSGFGPNGPGAIYQITPTGPSLFHDFGAIAGADPHPQPGQTCLSPGHNANNTNFNCWLNDSNSFNQVGKVGFGDLDINDTFDTLYTVNLADNTLLSIPIADPGAYTATAVPVPASCPAVDFRAFGIGVNNGKVYVGAVCSAESTQNREALRAYVFVYANGAFTTTPVLDFPLLYDRGANNLLWQYWLNRTTFNPNDAIQADGKWAQPWLTDIVFDHNDMILGLRDRDGDLFGSVAGGPDPADSRNYSAKARGDILRACINSSGGWDLESNGTCGGVTTAGANDAEGPGGGEYYYQDRQISPSHSETSYGALAQVAGLPDVVATIFNPIENAGAVSDSGVKWYNNVTGMTTRGYLVHDASGDPARFEKANGMGDIEPLCPEAPLEIGNRVWQDTNGDGVQGPGEPGINGVTVELYRDGVLVGTTVTANDGQYLFNDSNVNQNNANGIDAGLCGPNGEAVYEVRIPNAAGGSQQAPLAGLSLTQANNGGGANGDLRDSNGTLAGVNAIYAIPCSDLSAPGFNNHSYDFGFTPAQTYSLGNYVWIDTNNDGLVTTGEPPVPNGVVVELLNSAGAPTGQTSVTQNGFYLFSGLAPGSYRVRLAASNFQTGGLLAGYTSSTGAGQEANPDNNGDQNDNGLDSGTPAIDGITSGVITLTGDEPLNETPTSSGIPGNDGQGTPDADSNLTVDFGVVPPPTERVAIGNVVFRDFNNNGRFEPATGETGVDGAVVALLPAGADPVTATPLATTTTANGGFYVFDNLEPGQYFVYLRPQNFQSGAVLAEYLSSTGSGVSASIDDNVDENGIDNVDLATNGVPTMDYDLQPNTQPVNEAGAGSYGGALDDNNVNFTADFGVYKPLHLGNRVWLDNGAGGGVSNNGIMDGAEVGIANVLVRLLDGAGNPVVGSGGQPLTATTDAQGYYNFINLLPGDYIVLIDASNFATGGPLHDLNSSDPTETNPNNDGDLNDNGINVANPAVSGIRTGVITLTYDNEPTNETDLGPVGAAQPPDSNNLTIDFGFVSAPTGIDPTDEPTAPVQIYLPTIMQ